MIKNYPKKTDNMRIAICSALPPPFGGVTVHINRLIEKLRECEIPYRLYELEGKDIPERYVTPASRNPFKFIKFLMKVREPVVHFHTSNMFVILAAILILTLRQRKVILTFHSEIPIRFYKKSGDILRKICRIAFSKIHHSICVSEKISDWLKEEMEVLSHRISVIPAFLPPSPLELDKNNLSKDIIQFIKDHSFIIGTHGWFGDFVKNIHVYSFDMIINLIKNIRNDYPKIGFYTVISGTYDKKHREIVFRIREEAGLENDWLIVEKTFHAASLYARTNLFLRPSITDGDSVSIRECLYLGVSVIASDSVERPEECKLFKNRDQDDFERTVRDFINNCSSYRPLKKASANYKDNGALLSELYRRIFNEFM